MQAKESYQAHSIHTKPKNMVNLGLQKGSGGVRSADYQDSDHVRDASTRGDQYDDASGVVLW
jgi:hypothetical protein